MDDRQRLGSKAVRTGFVSPWGDSTKGALIDRIKTECGFYFKFTWATEENEKNELVASIINMPQLYHANVHVFVAALYVHTEVIRNVQIKARDGPREFNDIPDYVLNILYDRLRVGGPPKSDLSEGDIRAAMKINVIRYVYAIDMYLNEQNYAPADLTEIALQQEEDLGEMDVDAENPDEGYDE